MTKAEADKLARELVDELRCSRNWNTTEKAVSAALLAASRPEEGYIRTHDGKDLRVLGTLRLTEDGCVVGDTAKVWMVADNWRDGIATYSVTAHVDVREPDHPEMFADPVRAAEWVKEMMARKIRLAPEAASAAKGVGDE